MSCNSSSLCAWSWCFHDDVLSLLLSPYPSLRCSCPGVLWILQQCCTQGIAFSLALQSTSRKRGQRVHGHLYNCVPVIDVEKQLDWKPGSKDLVPDSDSKQLRESKSLNSGLQYLRDMKRSGCLVSLLTIPLIVLPNICACSQEKATTSQL